MSTRISAGVGDHPCFWPFYLYDPYNSIECKIASLIKWISGHVCELLLTSSSNSNSPNQAVLFVQTPFNLAKQLVLACEVPGFAGGKSKVCSMHSCNYLLHYFQLHFRTATALAWLGNGDAQLLTLSPTAQFLLFLFSCASGITWDATIVCVGQLTTQV